MIAVFFAVLVVILVLDAFLVVAVRAQVLQTSKQIHQRVSKQLTIYDELIEKKSMQLQSMKEALEQDKKEEQKEEEMEIPVVTGTNFFPNSVSYRSEHFTEGYQMVKNSFQYDPSSLVEELQKKEETSLYASTLKKWIEMLDYDLRYKMICLPLDMQEEILKDILDEEGKKVYQSFCEMSGKKDCGSFYDWMCLEFEKMDHTILLKTGIDDTRKEVGVTHEKSEDILEGFQIVHRGQLYDYSLEKRELM